MNTFPSTETTFLLPGPAGVLEVLTTPTEKPANKTAIICHPHPLHGGTMGNKVVSALAKTFHNLDLRTVRFNFRGVGKSEGAFADGKGELEDLFAMVAWVKTVCPQDEIWLAGFSFGAYIATIAATKMTVAQLVTIAPQASRFQAVGEIKITCPWVLVQGEQDEIVPPAEVFAWVETLDPKPTVIRMPKAGHFFHGQLLELRTQLEAVLKT